MGQKKRGHSEATACMYICAHTPIPTRTHPHTHTILEKTLLTPHKHEPMQRKILLINKCLYDLIEPLKMTVKLSYYSFFSPVPNASCINVAPDDTT